MVTPTLSPGDLANRRPLRLDPAELPLREIRRDPRTATFDWVAKADDLLAEAREVAPSRLRAQAQIQLGPFSLHHDDQSLALREDGTDRWRIELADFGGEPTLQVEEAGGEVVIALRDAFYPGTLIPASLVARIHKVEGVWTIRLRLRYGGFDATLPLSTWLHGMAVSGVHLDLTACPLGTASELAAKGAGLAAFTPGWLLATIGGDLFRLAGFPADVTADLQLVALLPPGAQPFFLPPGIRRTGIWLASDTEFPLEPEIEKPPPKVHLGSFRFDSLALEAGLLSDEHPLRVLFAQSAADPVFAGLEPGGDLWGSDGEPFRIPLRDPRYLQLFDHERTRVLAGLAAEIADRPTWLHSPGQSLLVSRPSRLRDRTFTLLQEGDRRPRVRCRVGLLETAPQVEGMLVRPRPAPPRTEMLFSWGGRRPRLGRRQGLVRIDVQTGVATVLLPPDTALAVVRRNDFLALGYEWIGRRFESRGTERRLVPVDPDETSHLAVVFPPQSIGEETFFESDQSYPVKDSDLPGKPADDPFKKAKEQEDNPGALDPPPVKALLAKPSRLVFELGDDLEVNAASLLDWDGLTPSLAPTALPGSVRLIVGDKPAIRLPGPDPELLARLSEAPRLRLERGRLVRRGPPLGNLRKVDPFAVAIAIPVELPLEPTEPSPTTTQIEIPFRLILSPNRFGTWVHSAEAVTHDGWSELWHTRLAVRSSSGALEAPHWHRTVRAIWARDLEHPVPSDRPFLMPLDRDDRRQLVHLTADYRDFLPKPVTIHRLMLTSLGGWLDSDYRRPPPSQDYSIEQWRHRATQARDHYARVVYKGFLLPFGHRASLVKISERKVQLVPGEGDPAAYLRQRMFLVVREPERSYSGSVYLHDGREIPLRQVRITTVVTPNLDPPADSPLGAETPDRPLGGVEQTPAIVAFWPKVAQEDFRFHLKARDWEDHEIDFVLPLAFVRSDWNADEFKPPGGDVTHPVDAYNDDPVAARREAQLSGQHVAYAQVTGGGEGYKGKTTFDTASMSFRVVRPHDGSTEPPCAPEMVQARVAIAALRQMTGSNEPATIEIDPHYLEHVFDQGKNKAGLFARVPTPPKLDYTAGQSADRAGGVATPSLQIRALSRELGTVGEDGDAFAQGSFSPQSFFSGIEAKILGGISLADILADGTPLETAPRLVTTNTPEEITTTLSWSTTSLKSGGGFEPDAGAKLELSSTLTTPKTLDVERTFELRGTLSNFTINLADVVEVEFSELRFTSRSGLKPEVHVEITDVRFIGALGFVAAIQDKLSPGNFADPPYLDVTPQGIITGYSLTIPTVAVGVFSLQNLALGARLSLPFTGDPMRLRFNLSERHDPFIVSVAPFGGGGFFALAVGVDGVEALEAALEFGGNISVDLGVASGGVSLMAGIYLQIDVATDKSSLTGYVRANGELEVIGIISLSIEFYLGLEYDFGSKKAWGEARVTVEIDVLLFSASVTVTMRRQFAGSSGDPPFGELMPQPHWAKYAAAFAGGGEA